MRLQTRFLAGAFRDYESRVRESGACDEHTLRERLMAEPAVDPVRHVIVTIPDWIADAEGLYQADFDLLTRIPGLESLDIVSTERVLASGFHERLHNWWPGLEEIDSAGPCTTADTAQGFSPAKPALMTPPGGSPDEPWWTLRDREEELVAIARQLKADRRAGDDVPLERTAIVYKNPLPYLYAAAEIFHGAGIPYQMSDALPLAAEPTSAALDLILDAVSSRFSRSALIALLRSPHFVFRAADTQVGPCDTETGAAAGADVGADPCVGLEITRASVGYRRIAARHGRDAHRGPRAGTADRNASGITTARLSARLLVRARAADCGRGSLGVPRAPRACGDPRHAAVARGRARGARRPSLDDRRARHRRAPVD
jgi:hypothetical protein